MSSIATLASTHNKLLEALRHREQEIFQYVAILIPALGGFAWLIYNPVGIFLFTSGTVGVLFLLFLGVLYSLNLGYNYRYITLQLAKLEVHLGIKDSMLIGWVKTPQEFIDHYKLSCVSSCHPKLCGLLRYFKLCGRPWCTPPGIIKVFWCAFLAGILGVTIAASIHTLSNFCKTNPIIPIIEVVIAMIIIVIMGIASFMFGLWLPRHYGDKLNALCRDDLNHGKWDTHSFLKADCKDNRSRELYCEIFKS